MKKLLILLMTFISASAMAQPTDCGTKVKGKPIIFSQAQKDKLANVINAPFTIKIFVTIFANDDGGFKAASETNVLRQIQNMVNQYQPQNICFILGGIRQVNNSDMNYHDAGDSTENTKLPAFLVNGFLNIFVHYGLPGLNGVAYGLPGTYLSISYGAMASESNLSTLGHEVGHCLGLYHTFENWPDKNGNPTNQENVTRVSGAPCQNCSTAGDMLCDTPADDDKGVNSNCLYIGGGKDACDVTYSPMTTNMMGYGHRPCRSVFTADQGDRMRSFLSTDSNLQAVLAHDLLYRPLSGNVTISSGTDYILARDIIYISDGNSNLTINGTANQLIEAKKISIKSGTKFSPASGGKVLVKSNPYCN